MLVALLAMTAGATDAISFLGLGGVFSSVMTANLVLLGLSAGERSGFLAAHAASALGGYVAGALAASRLVSGSDRPAPALAGRIVAALAAEAVLLAGFTAGWEITDGRPGGPAQLTLLASAALAMGTQSATVRALKVPGTSSTYMTGMLTGILGDLATAGRAGLGYRLALLGMLIAGAVASGFAFAQAPELAPVVILAPAAAVAAIALTASRRSSEPG
jgi:uncharacterized membrane protein YoaK (UPF0700 family)